jgi:hypothetical protein
LWGNSYGQAPDATVIIHQNMLNAFLDAVGPVSGTKDFNFLSVKGKYTWTLRNARIELLPDHARFLADANIKAGPVSYSSPAVGNVEVRYDPRENRIKIRVEHAVFEVYTKIFGRKIHIANVDAAEFYHPRFEFAGPRPVDTSVRVKLPDDREKILYIIPVSQEMRIEDRAIVVTSHMVFSDRPPHDLDERPR